LGFRMSSVSVNVASARLDIGLGALQPYRGCRALS
jgi:hypothetical protein